MSKIENLSTIDQLYIPQIVNLLNGIIFDDNTLENLELINNHEVSIQTTPVTKIDIFSKSISSKFFESKKNKRTYNITIRIDCYAINRELEAQQDISYLEEQIITLLENNLRTIQAEGFQYSDNDNISPADRSYYQDYYTKEISWPINKYVVVNN